MEDLSLTQAIEWLNRIAGSLRNWVNLVRPPDGSRGRFLWARETTRPANVASTAYVLMGLSKLNDQTVITAEDRRDGIAWVNSMHIGDQQYRDPAILERRPAGWPANKDFPDAPLLTVINQYSQIVLTQLGVKNLRPSDPPEGIPQVHESHKTLEYVRGLPWATNPWGAGSHARRMAAWLLRWQQEGKISVEPLIDILRFIYSQQDPASGLWGGAGAEIHRRINGTFKLFPLLCEELRLPLPHADKIVDSVLAELARPDYDATVGACDEWDNLYVLRIALDYTQHRAEDVRRALARRLQHMHIFEKPDGGLSYSADTCNTGWVGVDMAPPVRQGDCIGFCLLGYAIAVCVDALGLGKQSSWNGDWHTCKPLEPRLREMISGRLGL